MYLTNRNEITVNFTGEIIVINPTSNQVALPSAYLGYGEASQGLPPILRLPKEVLDLIVDKLANQNTPLIPLRNGRASTRLVTATWKYYNGLVPTVARGIKRYAHLRPKEDISKSCNGPVPMAARGMKRSAIGRPTGATLKY